jgi:glycosyltransferase involved in cell wall biosynthesis
MSKPCIAIYLQHYLSPSMTFVYRQLKSAEEKYQPIVLCSDKLENEKLFPFESIYFMQRNLMELKNSRILGKLVGWNYFLGINPTLSKRQNQYFSEILVANKTKLIHAHFGPSGLEINRIAKKLNIPLIVTFHGYDASVLFQYKKYKRRLVEELFDYAKIITVSELMKKEFIKLGAKKERIEVIRCGIPVEIFKFQERLSIQDKIKQGLEINFLQVSNFVEKKGHEYTVKAFFNFIKIYKNAKLILAGDGPLKDKIYLLCQKLELLKHVEFPGLVNQEQIVELMGSADIFLHHSVASNNGDKEGVPTVIMEAMASGLPVISTIHSGIPELIDNNQNGILVPEKDINAYSKSLLEIKNLPPDIGKKARFKVLQCFNLCDETQKLFNLYERVKKV